MHCIIIARLLKLPLATLSAARLKNEVAQPIDTLYLKAPWHAGGPSPYTFTNCQERERHGPSCFDPLHTEHDGFLFVLETPKRRSHKQTTRHDQSMCVPTSPSRSPGRTEMEDRWGTGKAVITSAPETAAIRIRFTMVLEGFSENCRATKNMHDAAACMRIVA